MKLIFSDAGFSILKMDETTTAKILGSQLEIADHDLSRREFKKCAKAVETLFQREDRAPVMRTMAKIAAQVLEMNPDTRNKLAHNLLDGMSKSASWHKSFDPYLRDAFSCFMEKKALVRAMDTAYDNMYPLLMAVLASGAMGGAGLHYLNKSVDRDTVDIEKQRAQQNEYIRLADELDRKVTARAKREKSKEEDNNK